MADPMVERPTRGAVFDPLLVLAKARVVTLVENGRLAGDDAEFILRALIDLESDGVALFGAGGLADSAFYAAVSQYLVARVGRIAVDASVLDPRAAEASIGLDARAGTDLDRAVSQLINHQGGHTWRTSS